MSDLPADFFDAVYARADGDEAAVPWQQAMSRRFIGEWFAGFQPRGDERAIVVAAGLGDDAAALAERGLDVTAFDFSPTAVDWARSRHADTAVDWHVADLFNPPSEWVESFDLVVEVFTVQSNEPTRQAEAAAAVRNFLRPGGTLVVVALVHDGTIEPEGPPWPLHPSTIEALADGLTESNRVVESLEGGVSCVLLELKR
ncbi:MAG: class I SAM-dependent methyltransferase [Acidimicrobiales bacterium]